MKNPISTFAPNTLGRDFVIGDLHGSFTCFETLLDGLKFDTAKDRMFSVGDLVDRGPESVKCLQLLNEPWFHAVLSNHEQMMLEAFTGGRMGQYWLQNGGRWGLNALTAFKSKNQILPTAEDLEIIDMIPKVAELPFLITINMVDGKKFHVIHAELPPNWRRGEDAQIITDIELSSPDTVIDLATTFSGDGDSFTWGRYLFMSFYGFQLENVAKAERKVAADGRDSIFNDSLSHIISGHTIMKKPLTIVGQTNIDTGAYSSYTGGAGSLTCVELSNWKFYQATPTEFRSVEPVVINRPAA